MHRYAQPPQAFESASAVRALGEIANNGRAFGNGSQHCQPMTNGFIARNRRHTPDFQSWRDFQMIVIEHRLRLAWSLTLKNSSCYLGSMTFNQPRSFELTIPSRLEEMQAVHELIGQAVKEYKLSDELAHWIELTISESMINAIKHGNQADPAKEATLRISSIGDRIEI